MDWTLGILALALGFAAGAATATLYPRRDALRQALVARRPGRQVPALPPPEEAKPAAPPPPRWQPGEEAVVLIPDGRPWPLGPALQLLEIAWRWQVAHGISLPLAAHQGEGAWVWRPPLPARSATEQPGTDAER